jgi:hypothetical protein
VTIEKGEEEHKFMNLEERYTLFKWRVEKTNIILEERYKLFFEQIDHKICNTLARTLLTKELRRKRKVVSND